MACLVNIRNLVNTPQNTDAFGYYEVIGVTFNGNNPLRFGRGSCPGVPVDINTGMTMAQVTDTLFNVVGGQAHNDNLAANWLLCLDDTENSTVQFRYTIERPGCPVETATFTIQVVDSCAYLRNHVTNPTCGNPMAVTPGQVIDLAGPNGVTNGVPWATVMAQVGCVRTTVFSPSTYQLEGGGTAAWAAQLVNGVLTIPNTIACGEPCVTVTFTADQPANTQCNDCDSSGTFAFLPPQTCTPVISTNDAILGSIQVPNNGTLLQIGLSQLVVDLNGVPTNLGAFPNVANWSGARPPEQEWEITSATVQAIVNAIQDLIDNDGDGCTQGTVIARAFVAPGDFGFKTINLSIYICPACGVGMESMTWEGGQIEPGQPYNPGGSCPTPLGY